MKVLAASLSLLAVLLLGTPAFAVGGGTVQGTFKFYNRLIHYCPSVTESRNCSGSNYNEDAHEAYLPVSDMKFVMRVNGVEVAEFSTDENGNYATSWTYPGVGTPTNAVIEGFLEHKDGEFHVKKQDGSTHRIYSNFTAQYNWVNEPSNSTGIVQNRGTAYWGTIERLNTYHAAWRTWFYALKYAGSLLTSFDTMDLWVGNTTANNSYSSSLHRGVNGRYVHLDESATQFQAA